MIELAFKLYRMYISVGHLSTKSHETPRFIERIDMAKAGESPKRSDGLNTMARLLEEAQIEIALHGIDHFDVDAVLERAKAARSSLYHHFGSKFNLIYAAQLDQLVTGLQRDNDALRFLVEASPSAEDFFTHFATFIHTVGEPNNVLLRQRRTQVFASATHNEQLAASLQKAQIEGTQYLTETLEILRDRGWINPPFDLHAIAYILQGMIFGHLILDFSHLPELESAWSEATIHTITTLVGAVISN